MAGRVMQYPSSVPLIFRVVPHDPQHLYCIFNTITVSVGKIKAPTLISDSQNMGYRDMIMRV